MSDSTQPSLLGRKILLGVSGGIAAYKTAELIRLFKRAGAEVQVLMTPDAVRFITPLTLGTLSEREVFIEIFPENEAGDWTKHVSLSLWADLFIVAPATAQTVAKLAYGFSDSMLTATALAARCPILVCPAMDRDMYEHPATQANLERIASFGYDVMPAAYGELASGLTGQGRLPEPADIFGHALKYFSPQTAKARQAESGVLKGKTVLVTAGPTHESIDPVRFISNHSSGRMGYALATAAQRMGAQVILVSGQTALEAPPGVTCIRVTTAHDMQEAVQVHHGADVVIAAAAVADFAPVDESPLKIKKGEAEEMTLHLRKTPDILEELGRMKRDGQILVGFALETNDGIVNARQKLERKNLDWIVLNNPLEPGAGFGTTTNRVTLIQRGGNTEELPLMTKEAVAQAILERVTASR